MNIKSADASVGHQVSSPCSPGNSIFVQLVPHTAHQPGSRPDPQCTVNSPGDNTEKSWKEILPICYWNFRIPYQSDNFKDLDQVVYVSNKIKQNLKIAPDNGEDMRAGGENPLWFHHQLSVPPWGVLCSLYHVKSPLNHASGRDSQRK